MVFFVPLERLQPPPLSVLESLPHLEKKFHTFGYPTPLHSPPALGNH